MNSDSKLWQSLHKLQKDGVLEEFREQISSLSYNTPEEALRSAESVLDIENLLRQYDALDRDIKKYPDAMRELELTKESIHGQRVALAQSITQQSASLESLLEHPSGIIDLNGLEHQARTLESAARYVKDQGAIERARQASSFIAMAMESHGKEKWDERFRASEFREQYDQEYLELKRRFDKTDPFDKKNLKPLKKMAMESQNLGDKYRSMGDEDGVLRSANLHQEIEEASERLAPIYQGWQRKNVTIGVIALALAGGFWKGDYLRGRAMSFLGQETAISTSEPTLPYSLAIASSEYPFAEYAIYMDRDHSIGQVYDLQNSQVLDEFSFIATYDRMPVGFFTIDSPVEAGMKHLEIQSYDDNFRFLS
ncbi:hypothetical protein ACFL1B_05140, partial [Nanoarchaeota archaeon]